MSEDGRENLSPKQYNRMIEKLDIENIELKTSSIFEAKTTLVQLLRLEESLLEIRKGVSGEIRAIKLKYLSHNEKSSVLGSFSLRKPKLSSKRKSAHDKCEREIGPYKKVLYIIDDYLKQIEEVKEYIDSIEV